MKSASSPDVLLWTGKVLKKGAHFIDSWKERELKMYGDRVDYYDAMLCLCGSIPLVATTTLEVINDALVNVHTIGRNDREKELSGRTFQLKFMNLRERDHFLVSINCVLQVVNTFSDPIVANVLPINEFITLDDGVQEYANSEDSPEIDFYFAAKRYIHDIDAGEAAWEARSQRRKGQSLPLPSSLSSASPPTNRTLLARAFGTRHISFRKSLSGSSTDNNSNNNRPVSGPQRRSNSGGSVKLGVSRYEDPLLEIESFSLVNSKETRNQFPYLLQKSMLGNYVQSFNELYQVVNLVQPKFEAILHKMKQSVIQDVIERYLEQGVTDEGGQDCVAAMMHQATGRVRTDIVLMPICDAISLLAECNIHHHIDYSAPVSNTSWPHICFPFGAVSPAACLINALSARVMCQSTAEVCAVVAYLETHATVVVLDNRFLDPLGQPIVYTADGSCSRYGVDSCSLMATSLLQLQALTSNGSYQRDIRMILAVEYDSVCTNSDGQSTESSTSSTSSSERPSYLFCEVVVEIVEMHTSCDNTESASCAEGEMKKEEEWGDENIQWNTEAEKLLQETRRQQQQNEDDDAQKLSDVDEGCCDDGDSDYIAHASVSSVTKTRAFYAGYLRDFFTKFRSWSRMEPEYDDMQADEVAISIRLQFSRDIIYRTELLRQITAFSLDDYLLEREQYFDSVEEEEEEEEERRKEAIDQHNEFHLSSPRRGFFSTLLRASSLTRDVKMMRSVSSLFCCMGLFSACAVLQRDIIQHIRERMEATSDSDGDGDGDDGDIVDEGSVNRKEHISQLAAELETLAVMLLKVDNSNAERQDPCCEEAIEEAIKVISEAISLRKLLREQERLNLTKRELENVPVSMSLSGNKLRVSNNYMVWMHDIYLLACLYEMRVEEKEEEEGASLDVGEDKAISLLQAIDKDTTLSKCEQKYFSCFLLPKLAILLEQNNKLSKAQVHFNSAISAQRQCLGLSHPVLYQTLLDYGLILLRAGDELSTAVAEQCIRESSLLRFQFIEANTVPHRRLLCIAEGYMAQVPLYMAKKELPMCKELIEKAFHIRCYVYGKGIAHSSLAECLVEYGLVCKSMNKYLLAVQYLEESLKMYYQLLGRQNNEVADTLVHLAGVLEQLQEEEGGGVATALAIYKMALKIRKELYDPVSSEVVDVLLQVGRLLIAEQSHDQAEAILFECLSLQSDLYRTSTDPDSNYEEVSSSASSSALGSCNTTKCGNSNTSDTFVFHLKNSAPATDTITNITSIAYGGDEACEIVTFALRDLQPAVAEAVNLIACNFKAKALYDMALTWYQHSLQVTQATYGSKHANITVVWSHIAAILKHQGHLQEAVVLYEKVLKHRKEACAGGRGGEGTHTAVTESESESAVTSPVSQTYNQGDTDSSLVAQALNNLAIARQELGEHSIAKTLFEEALALYVKVCEQQPDHRLISAELAALHNNLAGCLHQMDPRSPLAASHGSRAVAMAVELFGPQHSTTLRYRDNWQPSESDL